MDCIQTGRQAAKHMTQLGLPLICATVFATSAAFAAVCHKVMLFSVSVFTDADHSGFTNQIVKELAAVTGPEDPAIENKKQPQQVGLFCFRVSATRLIIHFGHGVSTAGAIISSRFFKSDLKQYPEMRCGVL